MNWKNDIQEKIGYTFTDDNLLKEALTHSSYTKEHHLPRSRCNERLEFLGDAFFDAIIGETLYQMGPQKEEGYLTKLRALIVCESSLEAVAKELDIGSLLLLGKGEEQTGGRQRKSVLADAMEAIIGAVFLDTGYEGTKKVVLQLFQKRMDAAAKGKLHSDYKSQLQEMIQQDQIADIQYVITGETGPDHRKVFYVDVLIDGIVCGSGEGRSKKEAQQQAAKEAVARRENNVL